MSLLVLNEVKVKALIGGKDLSTVKANTFVNLEFIFDREIVDGDNVVIRCHLYEPIFYLDYYLPDIIVTPPPPLPPARAGGRPRPPLVPSKTFTKKVKFPEELAGANIEMNFYVKTNPASIAANDVYGATNILVPISPVITGHIRISKNISITSSVAGAPKIETVYWALDEEIKFGTISTKRTATICRNETAILHIHTRGLYGKEIEYQTYPFPAKLGKIKNNTSTQTLAMYLNAATLATHGSTSIIGRARLKGSTGTTYPKSHTINIDTTNDATIIPTTTAVPATPGNDITPPLGSGAQCRVEFRPNTNYDGKFGFSWYRKGDLSAYGVSNVNSSTDANRGNVNVPRNLPCNDQAFTSIMGRHYDVAATASPRTNGAVVQNGNDASHFFDLDPIMAENHKRDYRKLLLSFLPAGDEYMVPVMTLRKDQEAELRLFIEARKKVWRLEFEFDNPVALKEGHLTITPSKIDNIPIMAYGQTAHTIKIKCLKEFSKELMLRVKAYPVIDTGSTVGIFSPLPDIAGAVRLLPNDISHQRKLKVVFFNVETRLNPPQPSIEGIAPLSTSEIDNIINFLGQAYVVLDISIVPLDLSSETDPLYTGSVHSVANHIAGIVGHGNSNIFDPAKTNDLEQFLVNKTSVSPYDIYADHFKLFFFGDVCRRATGGGLNGFSSGSREKFTVNFAGATPETPTHELGHALGLPHTFDGSTSRAKYVYRECMTDNIMDYSHHIQMNRVSFLYWQWKAMNNQLT